MLSRVAENLYWLGRYIARAENTARLISVHSHLLLDLPRGMKLGWSPLVDILGANQGFAERYDDDWSEANVVRFLFTDVENGSSVAASIAAAREILRTVRDSTPRDAWEQINALHLFLQERGERHLPRAQRQPGLDRVTDAMLLMRGVLGANMSHDVGYQFMRIGMNLEQADMTTRIVDVRTVDLIQSKTDELRPFVHIQWMSVLRSLMAYQAYRRHEKIRVSGPAVLRFLLEDRGFPRSVTFALNALGNSLSHLPAYRGSERSINRVKALIQDANFERLLERGLHDWLDEIQVGIAAIHEALTGSYFQPAPAIVSSQSQSQRMAR